MIALFRNASIIRKLFWCWWGALSIVFLSEWFHMLDIGLGFLAIFLLSAGFGNAISMLAWHRYDRAVWRQYHRRPSLLDASAWEMPLEAKQHPVLAHEWRIYRKIGTIGLITLLLSHIPIAILMVIY